MSWRVLDPFCGAGVSLRAIVLVQEIAGYVPPRGPTHTS